jgi:hypothetical protein
MPIEMTVEEQARLNKYLEIYADAFNSMAREALARNSESGNQQIPVMPARSTCLCC